MIITLALPKNAHFKIRKGVTINFGDPLYEVETRQETRINIAEKLRVKPEDIFRHVVKVIGEKVKKGELIAKKKNILKTDKIYSDADGLIKEINHQTGEIVLVADLAVCGDKKIITANFKGIIEDIKKKLTLNQSAESADDLGLPRTDLRSGSWVKIKIENGIEFELKDINSDGGGEVFYFKEESFFFRITEDQIKNKIIVLPNLKSHMEAKCEALGCSGFVLLTGKLPTNLPSAKIKNINDYQRIIQLNCRYVIYSKKDKTGIVYD